MKTLQFLSALEINRIEGYERFRNTKAYIARKSKKIKTTHELCRRAGYSNYNKFVRRRKDFDEMRTDIPLDYLNAIDVDLSTLELCAELDGKEFLQVVKNAALYPEYASVRLQACVYQNIKLEKGITEDDAVRELTEYAGKTKLKIWIYYKDFKTVHIEPGGNVKSFFYSPGIRMGKKMLKFQKASVDMGKVLIT